MKLKTIFCTAGLLLAMISKGNAQTTQHTQHDSIHLHIVQNKNGVMRNIDTTVAASQHQQLQTWLLSQGIDVPSPPPTLTEPDSVKEITVNVITDDKNGGGSRKMVVREINTDSIPGNVQQLKIIMLPDKPNAPLPSLPPVPPVPPTLMKVIPPDAPDTPDAPDVSDTSENVQVIIMKDSTGTEKQQITKTIIVNASPKTPPVPPTPPSEKKIPEKNEMSINQKEVNVYPNPSNGHITLDIDMPGKGKTDITIIDMNGKIVYSESLNETEGKISKEIDLGKNGKGMYTVQVQKNGNVVAERVIIQ